MADKNIELLSLIVQCMYICTLIIHDALAMMDVVEDNPDDIDMEQIELGAHDQQLLDGAEMDVTHIPN